MPARKKFAELIFDGCNVILMLLSAVIFIYPLLYCLFASFSDPARIAVFEGPLLLPLGFSLEAYASVFHNSSILRGLANTVFYVTAGTAINLLMTSFAAYVLSRRSFYWKKAIMVMIVITMYFSGGLIPFYMVVKNLDLIDTPWALLLPSAMNAFYMIIMRTYLLSIPPSLEESAVLDGANDFSILFRIILPLAMPVVSVMIIYYGVGHWNSWFHAMLFLQKKRDLEPLQLILRSILIQNDAVKFVSNPNPTESQQIARLIKYALIIITTVPIAMIYPFMQKHFIKGVMIGSIKE